MITSKELLFAADARPADFSLASADLELERIAALLFPGRNGQEAFGFTGSLLTEDPESILLRQETAAELARRPELLSALKSVSQTLTALEQSRKGVVDNADGVRVSKLDAAVDGLKKAVSRLEKNLSKQGAALMEENTADNRYAQLFRLVCYLRRQAELYSDDLLLLRSAFRSQPPESRVLKAIAAMTEELCTRDRVEETPKILEAVKKEHLGTEAFAVEIRLGPGHEIIEMTVSETREEDYAAAGLADGAGKPLPGEGITPLQQLPKNGTVRLFQEYLLNEVGGVLRSGLTSQRDKLMKLPTGGVPELLGLKEALEYYTAAADWLLRLEERGLAVCMPLPEPDGPVFRLREASLPEEACTAPEKPVTNDYELPAGGSLLLTGPNGSGKTACMVMAGRMLFLAQLGMAVPAAEMRFSPRDRLLTLFSSGESEVSADSRMGLEVQRLHLLREQMTKKSLFLLNEPMTSTGAEEGGKICVDLLLAHAREGIPGILVTHFNHIYPDLLRRFREAGLEDRFQSLTMETEGSGENLRFRYRLKEAPPPPSGYARAVVSAHGVSLAKMLEQLRDNGIPVDSGLPGWERLQEGLF